MSDIVLSASVRQNLLSLQSTADLLATTQNRLSTGNKVNTALDNPTNFFTAQSLNNRSSDISNLLDGVSNGVQVLQAANTGITSLQKLIDSAKSVANQALQAAVGYSAKSTVTTATIAGATADDLLGTTSPATAGTTTLGAFTTLDVSGAGAGATPGTLAAGAFSTIDVSGGVTSATPASVTGGSFTAPLNVAGTQSTLAGSGTFSALDLSTNSITFDLSLDGGTTTHSITLDASAITTAGGTAATADETSVITALNTAINTAAGTTGVVYAANNGGNIDLSSGTAGTSAGVQISNYTATGVSGTSSLGNGSAAAGTSASKLSFGVTLDAASSPTTVTIDQDAVNTYNTANSTSLDASSLSGDDVAHLINAQLGGASIASYDSGNTDLVFTSATSGTGSKVTISGTTTAGGASNTTGIADHSLVSGGAGSAAASLSFDVTLDGASSPTTVTIDSTARTNYNNDSANSANLISDAASALSGDDVAKLINYQLGASVATFGSGHLTLTSATSGHTSTVSTSAVTTTGSATGSTGITSASGTPGADLTAAASVSFSVTLDNSSTPTTVTLSAGERTAYNNDAANSGNLISDSASALSGADVAKLINYQVGSNIAAYDSTAGKLVLTSTTTGANSKVVVGAATAAGGATDSTGVGAGATGTGTAVSGGLTGLELKIAATGGGTATDITFGDGTNGTIKSLNDLNSALSSNNLLATIDNAGKISITTTNDAASATIGAITGTASDVGAAFHGLAGGAPVKDAAAQAVRSNLVDQYNNILDQIKTTSQDASYNGIDLLNGDQLKLTFNETGTSTLKIQGVNFDYTGLGLSKLTGGTDFVDNSSANSALSTLDKASSSLRTEASALGSNLSIVQIRQDFSKNLINVLQTGASNLTLADTNEEAANSQALSTRQSIAVSALSLANQSQQSVLQLLR